MNNYLTNKTVWINIFVNYPNHIKELVNFYLSWSSWFAERYYFVHLASG